MKAHSSRRFYLTGDTRLHLFFFSLRDPNLINYSKKIQMCIINLKKLQGGRTPHRGGTSFCGNILIHLRPLRIVVVARNTSFFIPLVNSRPILYDIFPPISRVFIRYTGNKNSGGTDPTAKTCAESVSSGMM